MSSGSGDDLVAGLDLEGVVPAEAGDDLREEWTICTGVALLAIFTVRT